MENTNDILDMLEVLDPEDRKHIGECLDSIDDGTESINEALSADDRALSLDIYNRIDRLVKGTFLISFLEIRRQIKAIQREISDMRKKVDQERREQDKFRKDVLKKISSVEDNLEELNKVFGQNKREREKTIKRNEDMYRMIVDIQKSLTRIQNSDS